MDLASKAYEIWKRATEADPSLLKTDPGPRARLLCHQELSSRRRKTQWRLLYVRTAAGNDALAWVDKSGQERHGIAARHFKGAECMPETPALPRQDDHHKLVRRGIEQIIEEEKTVGGQLGRPSGARFRTYERLMRHAGLVKGTLFESPGLLKAIDEIYRFPLQPDGGRYAEPADSRGD